MVFWLYWAPLILYSLLFFVRCRPLKPDALGRIRLYLSGRSVKALIVGTVILGAVYGNFYFGLVPRRGPMSWAATNCLALLAGWLIGVEEFWRVLYWLAVFTVVALCLPFFWIEPARRLFTSLISTIVISARIAHLRRQAYMKARQLRRCLTIFETQYGPTYSHLGGDDIDWTLVHRAWS